MFVFLAGEQVRSELMFAGKEACLRVSDPSAQFIVNSPLNGFCGTLQRGVARADQLQGSSAITFNQGKIEEAKTQSLFLGVYDPFENDVIRLMGNHSISLMNGPVVSPIVISGSGNKLAGFAYFNENITLTDASVSVEISLVSPLNKSIVMNGGIVSLGLDLDLVQDATLIGSGTVDCNNNALRFNQRAATWRGNLLFKNAGVLQLRGNTMLSSSWTFSADSKQSVIQGDNNILDISGGGSLVIGAGNELVLINVVLRGLGALQGQIIFGDKNAKLTLIGCMLEMSSSYTFSLGTVTIKNEDSLVIVGENSVSFTGNSILVLESANFVYDALSASNSAGIKVDQGCLLSTRSAEILARIQDANGPAMLFTHKSNVLLKSEVLSQNRTMRFAVPGLDPVYLDGGGFSLRFPQIKKSVIALADGQTVVLQNMVLESFYPEHIGLGIGSKIIFGDNVLIQLAGDASLGYQMSFGGKVTLSGGGNVLTLLGSGSLSVAAGKVLRLADIVIKGLSASGGQIIHESSSAVISCVDVDLQMDSNYSFSVGTMQFLGAQSRIITGQNTLTFSGTGKLVVDGVSLFYDTLSAPDLRNIQPADPDDVCCIALNGGKVRPISSVNREGDLLLDLGVNVLDQDKSLSLGSKMVFRGLHLLSSDMVLDGGGFAVQLSRSSGGVIVVPDGKNVTLKNMVLRDLAPEHIQLGVGSSLIFGDGVLLQLTENCVLSSPWLFSGKVVIDGRYKTLDLGFSTSAGIVVQPAGALKIINTNVSGVSGQKIVQLGDDSSIELMSSSLLLSGNCSFTNGSLIISNDVYLQGSSSCFSFASAGTFTLKYGAHFYVDSGISLFYNNPQKSNSHFIFEDDSSWLLLHNASLIGGSSGLSLDKGTLIVSGTSKLDGEGTGEAQAIKIQDSFNVKVQVGATLDLVGSIVYW